MLMQDHVRFRHGAPGLNRPAFGGFVIYPYMDTGATFVHFPRRHRVGLMLLNEICT
jgi:hypothetical protein